MLQSVGIANTYSQNTYNTTDTIMNLNTQIYSADHDMQIQYENYLSENGVHVSDFEVNSNGQVTSKNIVGDQDFITQLYQDQMSHYNLMLSYYGDSVSGDLNPNSPNYFMMGEVGLGNGGYLQEGYDNYNDRITVFQSDGNGNMVLTQFDRASVNSTNDPAGWNPNFSSNGNMDHDQINKPFTSIAPEEYSLTANGTFQPLGPNYPLAFGVSYNDENWDIPTNNGVLNNHYSSNPNSDPVAYMNSIFIHPGLSASANQWGYYNQTTGSAGCQVIDQDDYGQFMALFGTQNSRGWQFNYSAIGSGSYYLFR
jgi:hypothetical protein